jgi:hypothetical protein
MLRNACWFSVQHDDLWLGFGVGSTGVVWIDNRGGASVGRRRTLLAAWREIQRRRSELAQR